MYAATDRFFPLVVSALWGDITLEDIANMKRFNVPLAERGKRVSIADCRGAKMPTAPVRHALRMMIEEQEAVTAKIILGSAVLIDSPLLVAAMRGIYWLRPPPMPTQPFKTGAEAHAWLTKVAAPDNVVVPEAALRFMRDLDAAYASAKDVEPLFR